MSDLSDRVIATKNALLSSLGDNIPIYLENMKLWFRYKLTKEEFDAECRKILTPNNVYLHNQFMIAILNKIDALKQPPEPRILSDGQRDNLDSLEGTGNSIGAHEGTTTNSSGRRPKRKRHTSKTTTISERLYFEPFDCLDYLEEDNMNVIQPAPGTDANIQIQPTQRYCAQELFIPDAGFLLGRFLIGAWEMGLVNVDDNVAEYTALAVQVLLKNLVSAILMKRQHYRVSGDFYYDVGAQLKDPFLRNSVTRKKIDDAPIELDKEITVQNILRRSGDETVYTSACEEM